MYLVIKKENVMNDWERGQSGKTSRAFMNGKSTPEARDNDPRSDGSCVRAPGRVNRPRHFRVNQAAGYGMVANGMAGTWRVPRTDSSFDSLFAEGINCS